MYGKIQITGKMEVATGMHIGGSDAFAAIGAVDSSVVRDVGSGLPMVPGSSLKGKIRTLLARQYNKELVKPDDDDKRITRLFGSAKKNQAKVGRLLFSDMVLENADELRSQGLDSLTEVKFENSINRMTAVANPRQIERVVRGSVFALDLIYEITDETEAIEDIGILRDGLELLQYDYLGGSGSRGYGKVRFYNLKAKAAIGDVPDDVVEKCGKILSDVEM